MLDQNDEISLFPSNPQSSGCGAPAIDILISVRARTFILLHSQHCQGGRCSTQTELPSICYYNEFSSRRHRGVGKLQTPVLTSMISSSFNECGFLKGKKNHPEDKQLCLLSLLQSKDPTALQIINFHELLITAIQLSVSSSFSYLAVVCEL